MITPPRPIRSALLALAALLPLAAGVVPTAAQEKVLVPNRVIYPGETVELSALKELTLKVGKRAPETAAVRAEELDGKVARKTLLPGRYIAANALRETFLLEQGAAVQVNFVAGSLTITATAVTLQPGGAGDLVKVRNVDTGKIFSGTIMANGTVRVGES